MRQHARHLAVLLSVSLACILVGGCADDSNTSDNTRETNTSLMDTGGMDGSLPPQDGSFQSDDAEPPDVSLLDAQPDPDAQIDPAEDATTDAVDSLPPDMMGPADDVCAELDVLDLNQDGAPLGRVFRLSGQTGVEDTHQGTCSSDSRLGSEAIVRFRAPSTGTWVIQTLPTEPGFDTLIYVRTHCLDTGQELACNDDVEPGRALESRVTVDLMADQTVYIFVDHWSGLGADPFELEARFLEEGLPPELNGGALVIDDTDDTLSLLFEGIDPDSAVRNIQLNFYDEDGQGLLGEDGDGVRVDLGIEGDDFITSLETEPDGTFTGVLFIDFRSGTDLSVIDRVGVVAVDIENSRSEELILQHEEPRSVRLGGGCNHVSLQCAQNQLCVDEICVDQANVEPCPEAWMVEQLAADDQGRARAVGDNSDAQMLRSGRCGGGGGADVYRYTAARDGIFRFEAVGDGSLPVLYLRRFCDFNIGEPGRDLACDVATEADGRNAVVSLEMNANETVHIFVDSSFGNIDTDGDGVADQEARNGQGPYELTVAPASAPQLASAAVSIARDPDAFGIRLAWSDADDDVSRVVVTFLDDDGEPLPLLVDDVVTGSINVTGNAAEDGLSRAEIALEASRIRDFVLDFDRVDAVRIRLYDSLGLSSTPVTVVPSPPPMLGPGDDCDTLEVLNQCGLNLRCFPGEEDGLGTCEPSTPPRISSAEFFRGSTNGRDAYTVRVTGSDPERDVVGLRIVLRDADGVDLLARDPIPPRRFDSLTPDGENFIAEGTYTLPQGFPVGVASIEIIVLDQTFGESAPFPIGYSRPVVIPVGEPCRIEDFTQRCEPGALCTAGVEAQRTCRRVEPACNPEWRVGDFGRPDDVGRWSYSGTTRGARSLETRGTCGGGSPHQNVVQFLATTPGRYMCEIRVDGDRLVNTVLYVRSHCSVEEPVAELGCNDNAVELDLGLLSRVHFEATPRSPVFLFVDGVGAGFEAPYTVRCSLTERWPENPVE